jgi:hypothetical protein
MAKTHAAAAAIQRSDDRLTDDRPPSRAAADTLTAEPDKVQELHISPQDRRSASCGVMGATRAGAVY